MGHEHNPAAEAEQLRGLIRDAHAAVKDLRAAMREARQQSDDLAGGLDRLAGNAVRDLANQLTAAGNDYARELNDGIEAARREIAQHLFNATIEYNEDADNFKIVFRGAQFVEDAPVPYPERM